MVNWTTKKYIALAIVFIYVGVIGFFAQDIGSTSIAIITSGQSRSFQIATYVNFNETEGYLGFKNESDVIISMNFTLPHGTLIVNDPIVINGTAIVKGNKILEIGEVYVLFPNCLNYPTSYDDDQIPIQGGLAFGNILYTEGKKYPNVTFEVESGTIFRITASTQVIWTIDGDYIPKVGVVFFDRSNATYTPRDIVLHVYPQEQLTQTQTNKASVVIALAVFIFSAIGVASLFFDLWDAEDKVCKYTEKPNTETTQSNKPKSHSNKVVAKRKGNKT